MIKNREIFLFDQNTKIIKKLRVRLRCTICSANVALSAEARMSEKKGGERRESILGSAGAVVPKQTVDGAAERA
jgi:hypothetical protein